MNRHSATYPSVPAAAPAPDFFPAQPGGTLSWTKQDDDLAGEGFQPIDLCRRPARAAFPRQAIRFLFQGGRTRSPRLRALRLGGLLKAATRELAAGLCYG